MGRKRERQARKGVRKLKKGNGREARERHARAVAFCKENDGKLKSTEIARKLMEMFGYTRSSAFTFVYTETKGRMYDKNSGKGLKAYLDKQDEERQKAYERKMLEKELDRPKFFF